ncbi:LysR family transcriptional regulator [Vibrio sp. SS-MA-C1-2]|uniref:LysR family transcriptional regulator n=1 Tax=Vibrio sp. SS-MA-C1-2 TaxID=2908646 RepID=UPI001F379DA9|nr:LysR family transcriptional regulator [Vibrio sp. SS-MA-C1-2]UJF18565.1 LysR family transcriptional regulator [Vibrio sp. SS-MA-C1-2]
MKHTDLSLVPFFITIMEEHSLSRAAARMNISQPAVSAALKKLRDVYKDPLFNRTNYGVEPTNYALDIYPMLLAVMDNYTSTIPTLRQFNALQSNRVFNIATFSASYFSLMPKLAKSLKQNAPNITIETQPLFTDNLETNLRFQKHDLAICIENPSHEALCSEVIRYEELVVVYNNNHPRINDSISVEQFMAEQHVVHSQWDRRGSLANDLDIELLKQRNVTWRAKETTELLSIIENSELIGLVTKEVAEKFCSVFNLKYTKSPLGLDNIPVSMIWHPSRSNDLAHKWLREQLRGLEQAKDSSIDDIYQYQAPVV